MESRESRVDAARRAHCRRRSRPRRSRSSSCALARDRVARARDRGQQRAPRGRVPRGFGTRRSRRSRCSPSAGAAVRSFYQPISFVTNAGELGVGDVLQAARRDARARRFQRRQPDAVAPGHARARARYAGRRARACCSRAAWPTSRSRTARGHATRWRFEAGPFQVLVTGTRFELGWQPAAQSLSLTMKSGSVELSGGACLRRVSSSAALRCICRARARRRSPAARRAARDDAAQRRRRRNPRRRPRRRAAPTRGESRRRPASKRAARRPARPSSWRSANRERLAGHVARARTALLVLRRRFPESSEAGTAAFTLGRMAFDQQADYGEAARWFATYLAEQPNGPLMGDASGRLLEAHERQGDRAAARRDAESVPAALPRRPVRKARQSEFSPSDAARRACTSLHALAASAAACCSSERAAV